MSHCWPYAFILSVWQNTTQTNKLQISNASYCWMYEKSLSIFGYIVMCICVVGYDQTGHSGVGDNQCILWVTINLWSFLQEWSRFDACSWLLNFPFLVFCFIAIINVWILCVCMWEWVSASPVHLPWTQLVGNNGQSYKITFIQWTFK